MGRSRPRCSPASRDDAAESAWARAPTHGAKLARFELPGTLRDTQRSRPEVAPHRAPRNARAARSRHRELSDSQLSRAVQSLYDDQLKPYGRIFLKRLTEQAAAACGTVEPELSKLRARCERLDLLEVLNEQGGEWSVTFRDTPEDIAFIDVYNDKDPYPESMWEQFKEYCEHLPLLPGGRYACAMALHEMNLPFLRDYSLGQVCHIVQLAISQRKVLGYVNGGITPYAGSNSKVKDNAAAAQSVETKWHGSSVTTWAEVRWELREILQEAEATGQGQVALSNIKQVFRAKFQRELCETALGHSKVSELLQDQRMADICQVRLFQSGYQVLPVSALECGAEFQEHGAHSTAAPAAGPAQLPVSEPTATAVASLANWLDLQRKGLLSVRNTFVDCRSPPETEFDVHRPLSAPPRPGAHVDHEPRTEPGHLRTRVLSDAPFGSMPALS